jgi:hypothetical protein
MLTNRSMTSGFWWHALICFSFIKDLKEDIVDKFITFSADRYLGGMKNILCDRIKTQKVHDKL